MDEVPVRWERDGDVAVLVLDRPDKLNAWTAAMRERLVELLDRARDDEQVRAVVVTGTGRGFCAGQDLAETATIDEHDERAATGWIDSFERLYTAVRTLTKPCVMAVNGVCAGSGFQFALLGDLRVGHAGARMGQPELLSGIPSITGIWAMWSVLGRARTTEMILTGRLVDGERALSMGLLTELVDEVDVRPRAVALARKAGALPAVAVRLTKSRLAQLEDAAFAEAFAAARAVHAEAYASGEPQEHMRRFVADSAGSAR